MLPDSDIDIDIYIAELEAELFEAPCPCDDYASFNGAEVADIKATTKSFSHEISATLLHQAAKCVALTRHEVALDNDLSEHEQLTNESRDEVTKTKFPIIDIGNNKTNITPPEPAEDTFLFDDGDDIEMGGTIDAVTKQYEDTTSHLNSHRICHSAHHQGSVRGQRNKRLIKEERRMQEMELHMHRLRFDDSNNQRRVVKLRRIEVHTWVVLRNRGISHFIILLQYAGNSSLVAQLSIRCSDASFKLFSLKCLRWYSALSRWIATLLGEMSLPYYLCLSKIPLYVFKSRDIVCYRKRLQIQHLEACTKLCHKIETVMLRQVVTKLPCAALCIQQVYRRFISIRILSRLRQQHLTRKATVRVQKSLRGFLARKRLQRFRSYHFAYNDQAVSIFSDDITDLLECQNKEIGSTTWKPSKPIIVAANESDPDSIAKSCSSRRNEKIPSNGDYHIIEPPVPSIHKRERNNGIQWRIRDRQVAQAMNRKRIHMKRLGASGLAMQCRTGSRRRSNM